MTLTIRSPQNEDEWRRYYHLRWRLLRAPWGQAEGTEKDEMEDTCQHFIALRQGEMAGIARLQFNSPQEAQLRYMAVAVKHRRQGIGSALLQAVEARAREHGCSCLMLHARENALAFYQAHGYRIQHKSYLLFEQIQHFSMQKALTGSETPQSG